MKYSKTLGTAAGLSGVAQAGDYESTIWTTVVSTDYETYCPSPTTFTHHNVTYTATTKTTVTVTNCPCTVTCSQPPPVTTTEYSTTEYPIGPGSDTTTTVTYTNISSTVYITTPPPTTYWSWTEAAPYPTETPVEPSNTPKPPTFSSTSAPGPSLVPTAAATTFGPITGLVAVALLALAL